MSEPVSTVVEIQTLRKASRQACQLAATPLDTRNESCWVLLVSAKLPFA
jgi:hypothetical protein